MQRMAIVMLHTVLSVASLIVAGLLGTWCGALVSWELWLYGAVSEGTVGVVGAVLITGTFSLTHLVSTWAWMVGQAWGGRLLVLVSLVLMVGAPWPLAVLIGTVAVLVGLDVMVMGHRAAQVGPPTG